MRILFVCDYFPPFIKGGGELSSFWQAKKLIRKGVEVVVLAPRYKDKLKIKKHGFKQYWYRLPLKKKDVSPIIFLNPLFIFYQFYQILRVVKKEKINIIHCQQKYSVAAAVLVKTILKIPVLVTLRDYRGVCNHGFCLWKSKKKCNFFSFFKKDFLFYFKNYIKKKNIFSFLLQLIFSYFGRVNTLILSFFIKKADKLVCNCRYLANVYISNGYNGKKMITIYNFSPTINIKKIKLPNIILQKLDKYKYVFLYAGKLSLGKGSGLLISAANEIAKKRKDVLFIFAGKAYYPIKKLKSDQLLFLENVEYSLLIKIMSLVDIACIPSMWPEPVSRVTLEAFSLAKPVFASKVGGIPELVSKKNGWLFEPTKERLKKTLEKVLQDEKKWPILGSNGQQMLKKLENEQINKLISLYKSYFT